MFTSFISNAVLRDFIKQTDRLLHTVILKSAAKTCADDALVFLVRESFSAFYPQSGLNACGSVIGQSSRRLEVSPYRSTSEAFYRFCVKPDFI